MLPVQTGEGGELRQPLEHDLAGLAVAVLGHDALGDVLLRCILIIIVLAVEEHDLVRVLLNGAGFAQIGQQRALVLAALVRTDSCDRQSTGTFSSLAMIFSDREMSLTACCRFSPA